MIKKTIILILFFYFLTLFQVSFLVHFNVLGFTVNFVLITVILINVLEKPEKKLGIISAFLGGFFLDVFSNNIIGFYLLISLALAVFLKFILKKHVRIPLIKKS